MGRTDCTEPQCLYKGDLYLLQHTQVPEPQGMHEIKLISGISLNFETGFNFDTDWADLKTWISARIWKEGRQVRLSEGHCYTAGFVQISEERRKNCSTLFSSVRLTNFHAIKPMWRRHLHISELLLSHKDYQHILWLMKINTLRTGDADLRFLHYNFAIRVTQICVFTTRLFSLHNTLNYAMHRDCLRMVLLTDVYRNLTSIWIKL